MVGGGIRKVDSIAINSTNVFAALGNLKKKKGSFKKAGSSKNQQEEEGHGAKEQVFWAPAPLTVKSWADVDDEDDDDYYATTAPPAAVWGGGGGGEELEKVEGSESPVEESESEDGLDGTDDEENDHEAEETVVQKTVEILPVKDTDRQLSKKELKKKELAELDAVLAEFGLNETQNSQDSTHAKVENQNGGTEKKDKTKPAGETKAPKKKKKEKLSKETKEQQDLSNGPETGHSEEPSEVNMKEKIKKMASFKKKKSSKEMDAAARAAASEAAARSTRLAAAKKKEKNHYNQQPVR